MYIETFSRSDMNTTQKKGQATTKYTYLEITVYSRWMVAIIFMYCMIQ